MTPGDLALEIALILDGYEAEDYDNMVLATQLINHTSFRVLTKRGNFKVTVETQD